MIDIFVIIFDIAIGIDQLYGKISNTKSISHPERRMALMSPIFGHSLGGSTQKKLTLSKKKPI